MKKLFAFITLITISFLLSGCFKRDTYENISIYTSVYPVEYITNRLYGKNSKIKSIYPDGVNSLKYKLTSKQLKDYSKSDMFIFNGLIDNEKDYVIKMFESNKNIKIIDTTLSMEYTHQIEEIWLNPSNFLMMSQNIKNGLNEYITNHYLKEEINTNYENLKLELSSLDAKFKLVSESSSKNTIVVSSDLFKFLEKYNFNVISLEENDALTAKTVNDVTSMIKKGTVKNIFVTENEELNETIKKIIKNTGVSTLTFNTISNLSEANRKDNKDYISIMNDNIDLLKLELYN
jgi:ABC-type metal ion transport system, periplasmic component/surface adhesin